MLENPSNRSRSRSEYPEPSMHQRMTPNPDTLAVITVVGLPLKWRKFVASKVTQDEFEGPQ